MQFVRAFIAVDLAPAIHQKLDLISRQFKDQLKGVPIKWVDIANMHLTLKFLGQVSIVNLDLVKDVIQAEAKAFSPFSLQVRGVGAFPSTKRARVLWVGVTAPGELAALQRRIDEETRRLGYPSEERPFSPHLTLGRVSKDCTRADLSRIYDTLANSEVDFLGETTVDSIRLYRSDLKPGGAVYSVLYSASLQS